MLRRIIPHLLFSSQNQSLQYLSATTRNIRAKDNGRNNESSTMETEIQQSPFPTYTKDEAERILQFVNDKGVDDLLSYEITKTRINRLQTWMSRNGPLKSLQDILLIESFTSKNAKKFYDSLLKPTHEGYNGNEGVRKPKRTTSFISPPIDVDQQHATRSCVSVRIGVSSVTWSRLELASDPHDNSLCELTHWQHHEIIEKKLHLNDLIQRCLYLNHLIPSADCFVFEMPQTAQPNNNTGNAEQQNINIQKAQMTAVLGYALRARPIPEEDQLHLESKYLSVTSKKLQSNVFYLKRFLTARLFNNLVGSERVSSEQTILTMMSTYHNIDEEDVHTDKTNAPVRGDVQFPADLRQMFAISERYHREFLGQALLLNLAFVRLVLLQDANSIAMVTRNSSQIKSTANKESSQLVFDGI